MKEVLKMRSTTKEIKELLKNMGWKPGTLLRIKDEKHVFWILGPNSPEVKNITDKNGNVTTGFIAGQSGFHEVYKDQTLMFLGLIKTDVGNSEKQYYTLQFLSGDKVVFWDCRVLIGTWKSPEKSFEPVKNKG